MTRDLETLYTERIKELLKKLKVLSPGSREYIQTTMEIEKLQKALTEFDKVSVDEAGNDEKRQTELEIAKLQAESEKRRAEAAVEAAKIQAEAEAKKTAEQAKWEKRKAHAGIFAAAISAVGGLAVALTCFAANKSNQNYVRWLDNEAQVNEPKGLQKTQPRFPWNGKF